MTNAKNGYKQIALKVRRLSDTMKNTDDTMENTQNNFSFHIFLVIRLIQKAQKTYDGSKM